MTRCALKYKNRSTSRFSPSSANLGKGRKCLHQRRTVFPPVASLSVSGARIPDAALIRATFPQGRKGHMCPLPIPCLSAWYSLPESWRGQSRPPDIIICITSSHPVRGNAAEKPSLPVYPSKPARQGFPPRFQHHANMRGHLRDRHRSVVCATDTSYPRKHGRNDTSNIITLICVRANISISSSLDHACKHLEYFPSPIPAATRTRTTSTIRFLYFSFCALY